MLITPLGIVIESNAPQRLKALFPILVNPSGRFTELKFLQPRD